jgi:two-component system sensor histidine kinase KdpD
MNPTGAKKCFSCENGTVRGRLLTFLIGVSDSLIFGVLMLTLRSHVSATTVALVFVIPVVAGVVFGGLFMGFVSTITSALVFDFWFLRPYYTLSIGTTQNWTALLVYVVVVLLVARVVSDLKIARLEANRGGEAMRRVFELSELLVQDQSVEDLLHTIVLAVQTVFSIPGVSLLVLADQRLKIAASVGVPLSDEELRQLDPQSGLPVSIRSSVGSSSGLRTVALSASGRPIGILVLRDVPMSPTDQAILVTFANDAALALERTQLREQALRSHFLEEVDRLRQALMGAVSHDLRTPLATIKVASSTLANRANVLSAQDTHELHELIEIEADRLTRLVTNLLDMTRIEAGVLTIQRAPTSVSEMVKEAINVMNSSAKDHQLRLEVSDSLPLANIDRLLVIQVIVNLLDNALRHSPDQGVITVSAEGRGSSLVVSVADQGPGVALEDRESIFNRFEQSNTGGRAGLGLTIAKTFVEAHGEKIWYEDAPGGGARFSFSLPVLDALTAA